MDWFIWIILAIPAIGIGIAIYEHRKKRVFLKHDFNKVQTSQTETDRELERATSAMHHRIMTDNWY